MTRGIEKDQVNSSADPMSFGDWDNNPFAAQLKGMAAQDPNSEAAKLLEGASQIGEVERRATILRLGNVVRGIGTRWADLTFVYPNDLNLVKKEREMPALRAEWSSLGEIATLDSEGRINVLNMFARGLNVNENKKITRSQWEYLKTDRGDWIGILAVKKRPLYPFLNAFDRNIVFSDPAYVTLEATLELSDYPNPVLDSFQSHLASIHAKGELVSSKSGGVELPTFLRALSDWLPTLVEQPK